jgi:CRP-like cAMP-binding protein
MDKGAISAHLKAVPLFGDLSPEELEGMASATQSVRVAKGTRIFEEGDAASCCYVLWQGKARVVLSGEAGLEVLLHLVTPPRLIGEVALLDGSTRTASLVAVEDCSLLKIPAAVLEALRRNRAFENRLVASLVATLREADDHLRVISTFPAKNRVLWCLARVARYAGRRDGAMVVMEKLPDSELAEMAGCTRETVNRTLRELKRKRLVSWDRTTMRIDADGMQRYLPPA